MIIVWIRDIKGFKIWCISGSENYHVNFYKYFCFIANFFPDTLSIGKMELAQISINFEGLFVNDGGKILRKIRSLRKQCGGENPDLQFPNRPSSYYSHFVLLKMEKILSICNESNQNYVLRLFYYFIHCDFSAFT
jgi:hypothetical protein